MAGFLKRMFSFGKKKVEEAPQDDVVEAAQPDVDTVSTDTDVVAAEQPLEKPSPEPDTSVGQATDDDRQAQEQLPSVGASDAHDELVDERAFLESVGTDPTDADVAETDVEPIDDAPEAEITTEPEVTSKAEPPVEPEPEAAPEPQVDASSGIVIHEEAPAQSEEDPAHQKKGWFARLASGLSQSSKQLSDNITGVFTKRKLDDDTLQDLEDILIQADLGVETAMNITETLAKDRFGKDVSDDEVRTVMGSEIEKVLSPVAKPLELDLSHKPHVILVVGVNGTGKTTTIGKLAAKLRAGGLDVMLAAGDTFRAAAIEQLKIWGDRVGAPVRSTKLGADAAGLAFDALEAAKEVGSDVLIIDTAGRLQNKTELMDELEKIVRVLRKLDPEAPHTVLQTLDATTGQNALQQVEIFRQVAGVNGLVMTKLDGTARGGILVAIAAKHKLPVYFIGVGETIDDLEPFDARDFASAITGFAANDA